jgi:hypothetical protein
MSDGVNSIKGFLQRWSHRKHAAGNAEPACQADRSEGASAVKAGAPDKCNAIAYSADTLPPIESLTETSDIRAFLKPGVSLELQRAALRQTWVNDPRIRDFIGIAENQWDFTRPDSVPGFGSLMLTPELRRIAQDLLAEMTRDGILPATEIVNRDGSDSK